MSYWNQGYNRKKQEELAEEEKKKEALRSGPHPRAYMDTPTMWEQARERQRKEAFAWKVGAFVMAIMTGLFIWMLIETL